MTKDTRLALGFAYLALAFGIASAADIGRDMVRHNQAQTSNYSQTDDRPASPAQPAFK